MYGAVYRDRALIVNMLMKPLCCCYGHLSCQLLMKADLTSGEEFSLVLLVFVV